MKINITRSGFTFILLAFSLGCQRTNTTESGEIIPKTNVEVTHIQEGIVEDNLELFATTVYLKRNLISAPIPAFITAVNIRLGDHVNEGDVLFELESKERRALKGDTSFANHTLEGFGILKIKASASGIITTLDKQQTGDYILEGTKMCTISESADLAFQINVPYEYIDLVQPGGKCKIVLPDNKVRTATITTPLTTMNLNSQTETVLAKSPGKLFLPENLIVKVLINKSKGKESQILPKSCVQTDEMMKNFWVLKLINDSTAVRTPVEIGRHSEKEIEIISLHFNRAERIIETGGYGLGDTAYVKIKNS